MKLTKAQKRVLTLLVKQPMATSKTTHHQFVAGNVVASLARRGLVRWRRMLGEKVQSVRFAEITTAGIKSLQTDSFCTNPDRAGEHDEYLADGGLVVCRACGEKTGTWAK